MLRLVPLILSALILCSGCGKGGNRNKGGDGFEGQWNALKDVDSGYGERYALNKDGTFIYGCNQLILNRDRYAAGLWSVNHGELLLLVEKRLVLEGGSVAEFEGREYIEGADVREILYNPPEALFLKIEQSDYDGESGRKTIIIDGLKYFSFSEQENIIGEYFELLNIAGSDY